MVDTVFKFLQQGGNDGTGRELHKLELRENKVLVQKLRVHLTSSTDENRILKIEKYILFIAMSLNIQLPLANFK